MHLFIARFSRQYIKQLKVYLEVVWCRNSKPSRYVNVSLSRRCFGLQYSPSFIALLFFQAYRKQERLPIRLKDYCSEILDGLGSLL